MAVLFVANFIDLVLFELYSLSLHDALPIFSLSLEELKEISGEPDKSGSVGNSALFIPLILKTEVPVVIKINGMNKAELDRKSTRLNSSHVSFSYAVFCLKKKIA